jgi:sugar phosphate isomerase/epimerase
MQLGIFAKTFVRPSLEETLDAVVARGLRCIQFNFACAGLSSMPDRIESGLAGQIGAAVRARGLEMVAVSGTFNMIDPDQKKRNNGFKSLEVIADNCGEIGTRLITLCTGTRDPDDMWRAHPENDSAEAWSDLVKVMSHALKIAEKHDLFLGIEPELGNVINSAPKARKLLDELNSPRLKIIMDGANLLRGPDLDDPTAIWEEAFDLLGPDIIMAHAKDLTRDERFVAAGKGALDYGQYLGLLLDAGFPGPLILHGLAESEVDGSVQFLNGKLSQARKNAGGEGGS